VYLFVQRGLYAHQDTRTPFAVNVVENALNILIALALVDRYGVLGLGLAYACAYLLSAVWVLTILRDKVRGFSLRPIWSSTWRMLLAGLLMAEAIWLTTSRVDGNTGWAAIAKLLIGGGVGVAVYGAVLMALRTPELEWFRRRFGFAAAAPVE
jgi:putative peptidoglycan lipid II flippase